MPSHFLVHAGFQHGNNRIGATTPVSQRKPFGHLRAMGAGRYDVSVQSDGSRGEKTSMVGVFFSPDRQ